jgi:hypothetical protein
MMQTLEVPYPPEPAAGWTAAVAIAGEVGEEPVDDWDTNNQVVVELSSDSESLSDEELTAEPKPTGPSTILPPPARRTNIGV